MSLKSLGVDYLDMFILRGPPSDPHGTTIEQATQYMKVSYMGAVKVWPQASPDKHRRLMKVLLCSWVLQIITNRNSSRMSKA